MSSRDLKYGAKEALKGNWGTAILTCVIGALISSALGATLIGSIFVGVVIYGMMNSFLLMTRNGSMEIGDLFCGLKNFGTVFLASLLKNIYISLWSCLFFIPGIVKGYSYALTEFIIADNPGISCNDAITLSRKMMKGNKMRLFLMELSFIGWWILVALTFGMLALYVTPYTYAAKAQFYEDVKANYIEY